jgi:cyclopropane-fatty-acyl-phospholipid synthase
VRGIPDAPRLSLIESLAAAGVLPEFLQRHVFRGRIASQLASARRRGEFTPSGRAHMLVRLSQGSLADEVATAEPEETPATFFSLWLGPRMKYSCGLWTAARTLEEADEAMLALVCERAGLTDGMSVLDLGAGWGALSCHIAERFPNSSILAVTRSRAQADFIRTRAPGVTVLHADMRTASLDAQFDRVFAIEAIEHVHNPAAMLKRIEGWLAPGGRLFVQAIAHRELAYPLPSGVMLADDTLGHCTAQWVIDGGHYVRTVAAWRARLQAARLAATGAVGAAHSRRWRAFLVACEELFGWDEGRQWRVIHQLFERN